jgi:diguanylate cyclase (GGDEF)-like protein/putative nucleotidyltransferase with HDIG domain
MIYRINAIIELDCLRKKLEGEVSKKTRQLELATLQVITCVSEIIDNKSIYTKGHSVRVAGYAEEIAKRLGFSDSDIYNIYYLSLLHDIGKLISPDDVDLKDDADMTDDERRLLNKHCAVGADLLKEFSIFDNISDGARYHHERYDGKRNISNLKGTDIPLAARIIAVANAYDNMKSFRNYRKPLSNDEAKRLLILQKGKCFDPQIVDIMVEMIDDNFEIRGFASTGENDLTQFGNAILRKVITEYTDEIRIEAQRDALTGLWDRKYTEAAVNEYLAKGGSGSGNSGVMYMLDMDNFKRINDEYGHIKGDEALVRFASIIKEYFADDDILCRIGGDEFVVFSKGNPKEIHPKQKAQRVIQAMKDDIMLSAFGVSASIGMAVAPNDGIDFMALYNNSDKALYHVKQNGKSGMHLFSDIDDEYIPGKDECATVADLRFIKDMFEKDDNSSGAMKVEYGNFQNIYHFIERCIARTQQNVELVLFTMSDMYGEVPDVISLKRANEVFTKAVCENVRRGDVFTGFSSSQYVVILINVNEQIGKMIAERIRTKFYATRGDLQVELHFDLQPVDAR